MSDYSGLSSLVAAIKEAFRDNEQGDARTAKRLDAIETSVNEFSKKRRAPVDDEVTERKSATEMCHIRRALSVPKVDGKTTKYVPGAAESNEAMAAGRF